ncbi:hypothetical protein K1719_040868 [Acacia pycnantha]|nr:hypothetical protein K1719_040868 [Acacia pycnantha]
MEEERWHGRTGGSKQPHCFREGQKLRQRLMEAGIEASFPPLCFCVCREKEKGKGERGSNGFKSVWCHSFEIQRFLVAMDPLGTVFDKLKGFTKSSHEFFAGLIPGHGDRRNSASRNPGKIGWF